MTSRIRMSLAGLVAFSTNAAACCNDWGALGYMMSLAVVPFLVTIIALVAFLATSSAAWKRKACMALAFAVGLVIVVGVFYAVGDRDGANYALPLFWIVPGALWWLTSRLTDRDGGG